MRDIQKLTLIIEAELNKANLSCKHTPFNASSNCQ